MPMIDSTFSVALAMKNTFFLVLLVTFSCLSAADSNPQRIAVAGGSITEILYLLGEEQRIVGVDSTSQFPKEAKSLPSLGYVRNISTEGVLSLEPDLLLGEADAGPPKNLEQIKAVGVKTLILTEDNTIDAIKQKITQVAEVIGVEHKGQQLIQDIQIDLDALDYAKQNIKSQAPRIMFLLSLTQGGPLAAGNHTSAHTAIMEAGGINVLEDTQGWTKLSPEGASSLNPDVIVVMNREADTLIKDVKALPHFGLTNAVKNEQIFTIDGSYLLGFGPRTPQAIVELGTMIHAEFPLPEGYKKQYDNTINTSGH